MRKLYSIFLFSAFALGSQAQHRLPASSPTLPAVKHSTAPDMQTLPSEERAQPAAKPNLSISGSAKSMNMWEQVIGFSTYDLQTNNSVQDRIFVDDDDQVHATWTMSYENNTAWSDRGTGYNQGEGYNWEDEPVDRVESFRCGWPGLTMGGDNSEIIVNHDGVGALNILKRTTIGSGSWEESEIPTALGRDVLWPRSFSIGNTLHVIAVTESESTTSDGIPLNGVNGNLVYWRSADNGETWEIQDHVFDEIDSAEYSRIDGDSYAIHARDNHVSIGIFSEFHDAGMLHSMDGGDTWEYMLISDFEIPGYQIDSLSDADGDLAADTIFSTEGNGDVHIDANGVTHVLFGSTFILDDTPGDELYSFFTTFDLVYWNSTWPVDSLVLAGEAQESEFDDDEDFTIDIDQIPSYRASLASMPSMAEDSDGRLFFVYSAADEDYLDNQVFRHLWVGEIEDGGESFAAPVEITPDEDEDFLEYIFPSMTEKNDHLHIVAQRDDEPGLIVAGDLDNSETNDIIYIAIGTDLDIEDGVAEIAASNFSVYPNPSSGIVNLRGENLDKQQLQVFDAAGRQIVNTVINGNSNVEMDFSFLPEGIYTVTVGAGENKSSSELLIQK